MSAMGVARAEWIAQLGDLGAVTLPGRQRMAAGVREAGELRRDHPGLTHGQLAALMGVSTRTYERRLRVFLGLVGAPE